MRKQKKKRNCCFGKEVFVFTKETGQSRLTEVNKNCIEWTVMARSNTRDNEKSTVRRRKEHIYFARMFPLNFYRGFLVER